jgi:hypothetical protein
MRQPVPSLPRLWIQTSQTPLGTLQQTRLRERTNAYICASIQNTPTRLLLLKVTGIRWPKGFPPLSEPFHPAIKIQTTLPSLRSLNSPCYCRKGIRSPYDCHVFKKKVLCSTKFRACVTLYRKKWHTNRPKLHSPDLLRCQQCFIYRNPGVPFSQIPCHLDQSYFCITLVAMLLELLLEFREITMNSERENIQRRIQIAYKLS